MAEQHATDRTPLDATALPLCQFLARLFIAPPDAKLLQSCRDGVGARLLADCAADPRFAPGTTCLMGALRANCIEALSNAWTLLFSGAGGPANVPPYASAYAEGRLYGAAAARMQAELSRLDLAVAGDCREPPDHVAIQLTILAELLWREPPETAEAFRRTELAWLPAFCGSCATRDSTGFYAGAALLLAALAGCEA
ncbi:MAG: molecular chaperone TorD family protein [Acetobacteraceae bacterium]|nr:molecular chaperone TorD family protein [Acetobacteraceae bacterium]